MTRHLTVPDRDPDPPECRSSQVYRCPVCSARIARIDLHRGDCPECGTWWEPEEDEP